MNSNNTNEVPPRILREDIEWADLWLPHSNDHDLPRCLLIGDSITMGYYPVVAELLKGQAYVGRFSTSKSIGDIAYLQEIKLALSQAKFDVIHFNNGLHGFDYSEAEYERDFPQVLAALREGAPGARLIWANITPVRVANAVESIDEQTERVRARNSIAARYVAEAEIPTNDLFSIGEESGEFYSADGVHFTQAGSAALGARVAEHLRSALDEVA